MSISDIINQEDIPAILINEDGIITAVNNVFEKSYGWKKQELINKPLVIIIPEEFHTAHDIGFSRFLKTETPTLLEKPIMLSIKHAAGGSISAEHTIFAEKKAGKWIFAALIKLMEPDND